MTHHLDSTTIGDVLKVLVENGLDGMAEAIRILLDEAMKLERSAFLDAGPYERADGRRGYANGFKSKTVQIRVDTLRYHCTMKGVAHAEANRCRDVFTRTAHAFKSA